MPARHSKNSGDKHHFTYNEKVKAGLGSIKQRLGAESQLPFGYCCLSLHPAENPVVSPSGHIYSKEFIFEYLLTKSNELKQQRKKFEEQQKSKQLEVKRMNDEVASVQVKEFIEVQEGVKNSLKRASTDIKEDDSYKQYRRKLIDDTDKSEMLQQLKYISPWVPQFTPHAEETKLNEPPKRPSSPFSGQPLRSKDLIPIDLVKETETSKESRVHYICPVSRKTITNQKVVLIKNTGCYMIEKSFKDFAQPTMTCPITGKKFNTTDVLTVTSAASGFSASGSVESKVHRPSIN